MRAKIEKLIYGGDGLARVDGAAIFVPFVLPGEEVDLRLIEQKKKFQRGEVTNLLTPSSGRVQPHCPYFTHCGGCQYQHISYEAQLKYKEEILRETLRRTGGVDWKQPITIHPSQPWRYRNRAQWKIRPENVSPDAAPAIGYMRASSLALCPVEQCPVISPLLETMLAAFHLWLHGGDKFATQIAQIREVEAFADHTDDHVILALQFSRWPPDPQRFADALHDRLPHAVSLLFRDKSGERVAGFGSSFLLYRTAETNYQVSHDSFFQVNRFLIDTLVERVLSAAGAGKIALDLFAGVGLFSTPLAKNFQRVFAVESNPSAVRDLCVNATVVGDARIESRQTDVSAFLRKPPREAMDSDAAVLDPPRSGLPPAAIPRLCKLRPRRIIYVSCEPSTLARDLALFQAGGYTLRALELFDHFPQTFHIESLAILERSA
jgi:23S rRNA (uracil1939-C5)-methyltransferase